MWFGICVQRYNCNLRETCLVLASVLPILTITHRDAGKRNLVTVNDEGGNKQQRSADEKKTELELSSAAEFEVRHHPTAEKGPDYAGCQCYDTWR